MTRLDIEITVRILTKREDGKFLLVHNRPKFRGKRAGWGLPGGSILTDDQKTRRKEFTFIELAKSGLMQIREFMRYCGIPEEKLQEVLNGETRIPTDEVGILIFLTVIREGLEETGVLFHPQTVVFEEMVSPTHKDVIVSAKIVAGEFIQITDETDNYGWYALNELPEGYYFNHKRRLHRVIEEEALYA